MSIQRKPDLTDEVFTPGLAQSFTPALVPSSGKRLVITGGEVSVDIDGQVDILINGGKLGPGLLPGTNGGSKLATTGPISGLIDEEIKVDVITADATVRLQTIETD